MMNPREFNVLAYILVMLLKEDRKFCMIISLKIKFYENNHVVYHTFLL